MGSKQRDSFGGPGEVLLISCYELGRQPFGVASALGFLEEAGFRPAALDLAVEELDEQRVSAARFIAISVPMHTALRIGISAAKRVRRINPSAHVCFFGLYAPLNAAVLLGGGAPGGGGGRPLADSVIGGELEEELVEQVGRIAAGEPPGGTGRPVRVALRRLAFADPSRAALPPLSRYAHLIRAGRSATVAGHLEASRGCLHRCRHCPVPALYDGRFFVVDRDVILRDVRRMVESGASHITFGDPDFLNGPGHAMAVVRALHAAFPDLTFDVTVKISHILRHRDLLAELRELGCLFVISAVESLSAPVLEALGKGHSRADVEEALALLRAAGLPLRPSLVPFTPWETLGSYADLFSFVETHGLIEAVDPVHYTIRLLLPAGSLLLDHEAMTPHLRGFDPDLLGHRWVHPDPRMDELQREAAGIAARDAVAKVSHQETFYRLKHLAFARVGRCKDEPAPRFPTQGTPRMSETWFC